MAATAEEKLQYILRVLKHTTLEQPDYHAVCKETGVANANNAQKKFKAYIEQAGFRLVNKQVVDKEDKTNDDDASTTKVKEDVSPKTPKKKRGRSAAATTRSGGGSTKKRKVEKNSNGSDDQDVKVKSEDEDRKDRIDDSDGARSMTLGNEEEV